MRRSNRGRDTNSVNKWANVMLFFVLAPIVAISLSVGLVKYLILPHFLDDGERGTLSQELNDKKEDSNDQSANNTNKPIENTANNNAISYKLEGMDLFNIQIGSFSNKENAEKLVNELKDKGFEGYIISKDSYKVFTGTFFLREEAERYLENIREIYSDAFIKRFAISGSSIEYYQNDIDTMTTVGSIVEFLNKSFGEEAILWSTTMENNNIAELKDTMLKNNLSAKQMYMGVTKNTSSEELNQLIDELGKKIQQREDILNSLNNNTQSLRSSYAKFNTVLFEYMKIITNQG